MSVKVVQGWVGKVFLDRACQKGVSLLRAKSKVGTVSTVGRPLDRPVSVDSICELVANFYSLKTK